MHPSSNNSPTTTHEFIGEYLIEIPPPPEAQIKKQKDIVF